LTARAQALTRRRALALLVGGAAAAAGMTARIEAAPTVLRVAYIPIENCAQVLYAKELGFFASANLDVQLQPIPYGSAIASAIAANTIDIGYAATVTVATAHSHGLSFVFVAPANEFSVQKMPQPTSGIVVSATSTIRTGRDLNGKTFGTAGLSSLAEFAPRAWVDANGGDSTTLKFVELPFSQLPEALATGRVDAAFITDPFFSQAKANGRVLGYGLDAVAKEFLVGGWIATSAWATAHPAEVAAFAGAVSRATVWARANPAKAVDILVRYLKVDPAIVSSTQRSLFADTLSPALVQPGIDNAARYGKFAHVPAEELIYAPRSR
jgi:NitT/TauT family transport system substrate-binding protein